MCNSYSSVWVKSRPPQPAFCDRIYNWKKYFDNSINKFSGGWSHTPTNPGLLSFVRLTHMTVLSTGTFCSLKVAMEDGVCRVQWQPSANLARDAKWHGQDGGIGSPGFVVLPSIPIGPLSLVTYRGSIQVQHSCMKNLKFHTIVLSVHDSARTQPIAKPGNAEMPR